MDELREYDSLETNPLINAGLARQVEELLRGYEPVADGHGNPKGLDLAKDGRTEYGYYWEFEDIAEAAERIAALLQDEILKAQQNGVAWVISLIDKIHINAPPGLDKEYKGLKNTIRDAYELHTGVDPAPSYPVKAQLQTTKQKEGNDGD